MAQTKQELVIDASNATLGRLASYAAKQAMLGKNIVIVNCSKAVVSGKPRSVIEEYRKMRQRGGSSPHGPLFPKSPERIVKRTVRGMLAHRSGRGKDALKRVICYEDVPGEFEDKGKIKAGKEKSMRTITLKKLSEEL